MVRSVQTQGEQWPQRVAWGDQKGPRKPVERKKPAPPVRRDDIKLIQPQDSGLDYPVVAQWNEEHGSWDVLRQL